MAPDDTRRDVAFADNTIGEEEAAAVSAVLRSGWLSADREVRAFEEEFAAAAGSADAVFVSSGTAALHLAVLALDLRSGDEVIMPSLSFVSAAAVCALHGVVPVFADIESVADLTVSVSDVERLITPRTRAIVVMHYGGHPAHIEEFVALARRHGLRVIEDAAHAPLVSRPGGMLGTIGDIGCFSFFATKNMTTGEGGMVLAKQPAVLARVRSMRSHCIDGSSRSRTASGSAGYDIASAGLNYRPTELAAAIGRVQLAKLDKDRARRRDLVSTYHRALVGIAELEVPFASRADDSAAHHLLPVLLPRGHHRDRVRNRLRSVGVPTSVHYPPTHLMTYYRHGAPEAHGLREATVGLEHLPHTEAVADRLLSLPLHAKLDTSDAGYVADRLAEALAAEEAGA
ncbi:DegT/DnrJ/EryC1/StrS family aminotransferase [Streptomyces silvisoli]|uniref:DegT/DnrJ/EryC1/StrS aminotransferase family protein n=1 Tax=Streptomyces silvisoli TaxID=3034235 RepID=A0ABT5ZUG8_9ACTN|nr:DegT/DnrJ/EryC1/StrS aminotransferase family protein [Streptomyces silvisoli]MDF3292658.1 DegT/DnrJ/EryC1/StrS aminotransferase family protein [Streptomyces silvisoli]